MDGAGKTTITWGTDNSSVDGRIRRADGTFGPTQALGLGSAQVVADDLGRSYLLGNGVAGENERRVYYRKVSASGALGPAVPLSQAGAEAFDPAMAVDARGDVVASWEVRNQPPAPKYRVQIRAISASGARSAIRTLPGYGALPRVAMDPGGDATVFWWRKNGFDAVKRDSGGTFDAPIQVSPTGVGTHDVLMDSSGNATFLYKTTSLSQASDAYLRVRRLSSTGGLTAPFQVGKVGRGGAAFDVDGSGDVLIAWTPDTDAHHAIRDRVLTANGALGPPQSISAGPAIGANVAVNPAGEAVIGWLQPEGYGRGDSVQVVRRAADGTLGSQHQLSTPSVFVTPKLGIDNSGDAIAAWTRWPADLTAPLKVQLSTDP